MIKRRAALGGLAALFGLPALQGRTTLMAQSDHSFPPVPQWRPTFAQPTERIIERMAFYMPGRDILIMRHGTCILLEPGLTDAEAQNQSDDTIARIFGFHPDMNPVLLKDGNVLVSYNYPAANLVLADIASENWDEIDSRHLDGLTTDEVLITPLGPNRFDDFGKKALLGRAYMFMDAQDPETAQIVRG